MTYYQNIKEILVKNEIYKQAKDYSKNKHDLESYYEVGKLLVEAQGGEARAKYGNKLIKEYSEKLTRELGQGYTASSLKRMRQFYLIIQKGAALRHQLSWTHYKCLLPLGNILEINYYIYIAEKQNLSYRELHERIKSNEYERIGYKEELEKPKVNTFIKNPVVIKAKNIPNKLTEYALHRLIIEDMEHFLKELGVGFAFIGHEIKIKIGPTYHRIDFLLFNVEHNCYVVLEIKVNEFKRENISQTKEYMNYVNKHIKKPFHNKTIGIILCKKENDLILEYVSDERIFTTTYKLKRDDLIELLSKY